MEISHKEFNAIIRGNKNMRGWKKMWGTSVKNKKIWDWIVLNMWLVKNYQTFYEIKKIYFLVCVCIKWLILAKTYENNDIEVIVDGAGMSWLNEKHIEEKLGHKNLPATTNKYDSIYKKHRYELVNRSKKNNQTEDFYVVIWH